MQRPAFINLSDTSIQKLLFLPALLALIFYNYAFNRGYFMLVEGRSYIAQAIRVIDREGFFNWLSQETLLKVVTERTTNKLFYLFTSSVCGIGIPCQNFFQIVLIAATAFLFAVLLRQLKVPLLVSILIATFWVFSHSVLVAVHWQATGLEKLLGFFTLLYLVAHNFFLSQPYSRKQAVLTNMVLSLFLLAALSSKEHSVLISPIALVLALIFVLNGTWNLKDTLKRLVLPIFITFVHGVLFLKFIAFPLLLPGTAGIYDGNPASNFFMFMGFAFNSYENYDTYNPIVVYGIWGSFVALIFVEIFKFWKTKQKPSLDFMLMIWAGLSSLSFLAAMARLHYQNRYYLLVPSFFLFTLFYLEIKILLQYLFHLIPRPWKKDSSQFHSLALVCLLVLYGFMHLKYFADFYRFDFVPFVVQSQNFLASRKTIEDVVPDPLQQKLYFISEVHGKIASILHSELPPEAPRYVGAFWLQNRAYAAGPQVEQVKFIDKKDFTDGFQREDSAYYILFDHDLNIEKIDKGNSNLFVKSSEGNK